MYGLDRGQPAGAKGSIAYLVNLGQDLQDLQDFQDEQDFTTRRAGTYA
jgi:hypothetical protein